ncbi:MAG: hypothetical protein R3D34_04740 [Nitratireductor sp.]
MNKSRRTRVRTFIRSVGKPLPRATRALRLPPLRAAQPEIMRAVTKGI